MYSCLAPYFVLPCSHLPPSSSCSFTLSYLRTPCPYISSFSLLSFSLSCLLSLLLSHLPSFSFSLPMFSIRQPLSHSQFLLTSSLPPHTLPFFLLLSFISLPPLPCLFIFPSHLSLLLTSLSFSVIPIFFCLSHHHCYLLSFLPCLLFFNLRLSLSFSYLLPQRLPPRGRG